MPTAYKHLRVEDSPPPPVERKPILTAPAGNVAQLLKDVEFYKSELRRAVQEREEIKRSLEATDGPAAYWRREYKGANARASDAMRRLDGARKREQEQRDRAIALEEQLEQHEQKWQQLKRRLWDLWTDLGDTAIARALHGLWTEM